MRQAAALFTGLAWLTLLPCLAAQTPAPPSARGERLFAQHCAPCHGPKGEGARGIALTASRPVRDFGDGYLFEVIRKGIPGTEMPPISPALLSDTEVREVAAFVRSLHGKSAPAVSGHAARGEQLYRGRGKCAQCHTVNGQGGVIGPDLSDIGARRGPAHLRTALLDPQAYIPENFGQYRWFTVLPDNFLQVRLVTSRGQSITGVRLNEDPFSIQVRDLGGRAHSFWKSELKELHKDWGKSPMPSFKSTFDAAEIEDLVAYLVSLRESKATPEGGATNK